MASARKIYLKSVYMVVLLTSLPVDSLLHKRLLKLRFSQPWLSRKYLPIFRDSLISSDKSESFGGRPVSYLRRRLDDVEFALRRMQYKQ